MKRILTALALATALATPTFAQNFGPPQLIADAKKEGRLVYYTANFAEVEQEVIKAFNKRFPEIKVEMVRAPGGSSSPVSRRKPPPASSQPTWSIIPIAR